MTPTGHHTPYPAQNALITQLEANADLGVWVRQSFEKTKERLSGITTSGVPAWQAIGPGGVAALLSIQYNFGNYHTKSTLMSAAKAGDVTALYNAVYNLAGGNPKRHQEKEAPAITTFNSQYGLGPG